jgi:class 3 adenylate cyclase
MNDNDVELGMVVIVDDEQIITNSVARQLRRLFRREKLPYKVVTSQEPEKFLEEIESHDIDLAVVISDIMMEPMDGLDFLRAVQTKYPDALLIALTGYAGEQAFRVLRDELELYSYQEKPWEDDELKRIIKNALDSHRRKKLLNRYVPKKVVTAVLSRPNNEILEGQELEATILFLDVRDSTHLFHSETLGPKEALKHLNMYFKELLAVLGKYNGILDKFMGDGMMALFGVPDSTKTPADDAKNAVLAALEMREAVQRLNQSSSELPLEIGVGISTGLVIAGNIGSEEQANYTVLGNDVNIAFRLERAAKPIQNGILMSQRTYQYVKDVVEVRAYEPLPAKGKRDSVPVYEVVGRVAG